MNDVAANAIGDYQPLIELQRYMAVDHPDQGDRVPAVASAHVAMVVTAW